ncbi:SusC/RagA family TonB-linked outer membrane protein [Mucilaginibacter pedocola]|uniref:SusC/RagA family TonB-linked outer membrane protein n=1 Tax=Mucilaginibacter pedocola TaxID=1792845 RepID=A0A1S9P9U5_9SPHI|nr:SusC/RagA family TonB-linked outer membrane protein [Mucilaginibacter pedocola]OOQ57725.1 SusC/RagA family TonB-linked outer membrane protein [Mucilaginibacter pedocola]
MKIFFNSVLRLYPLGGRYRKAMALTLLPATVLCFQPAAAGTIKPIGAASTSTQPIPPATITGKVTDSKNLPLPGVNVQLKGTTTGTTTDINGNYRLTVPNATGTLVFSFIGFASQEVTFSESKTTINIQLLDEPKGLDEVVVVGYGTQRRGEVTSAVSTVKAKDFVKGSVNDAAQLIRGKVPGLSVVTTDGNPTATAQVNLRGIATLNASTSPLVIIDGVPGTLTTVAPEDIESVDVLKDGSAAAIYGTRGTNGVILITTRKAKGPSAPKMEFNTYFTTQRITKRLNFLNADEYRQYVAQKKPGATDYGSSTDWLPEVLQNPFSQVYNIDLKGSNENTNYVVNLNYRNLNGIMQRSNNKTIFPRIEVNHNMFDGKLKLNANINGYEQNFFGFDGGGFRGDVYRNAIYLNPTQPVKEADGSYSEHVDKTDYANPVSLLYNSDGIQQNTDLRTIGSVTFTPITDLDFKVLGSRDLLNNFSGYSETKQHYSTLHDGKNGYAARGAQRNEENLLEATINYKKNIGLHAFTGLAGYSWRETDFQSFYAQNYDFPTNDNSYNSLQSGRALSRGQGVENSYRSQNKLIGYFFRLNYAFNDKYLLMASIRREGSSKFGVNHKWGNFPAASVGWNVKKESFLVDNKTISSLKFRAGYGITGTEPASPYLSLDRINFNTNTYVNGQWIQAINPSSNANPDLRWERKKELNVGMDIGVLDNRITATVDYYNRTTSDLLFNYPVATPPYLYNNITANAASMENKGIEVGVNIAAVQGKDFTWNTQVNYSTNKNKILSLSDKSFQLASGYFDAGFLAEPIQTPTSRVQIGQPIGNFWGFKSVDIDDAGHWIVQGKDGNPKPIVQAQADDKQIIGNGLPKHYLAWNNSFSYKGFDLNITMRGAFGFQILNTPRIWYDAPVMMTRGNLLKTAYDNVYGKRPLADDQSVSYVSYYIENGDYWKIDNVTLGYNLAIKSRYIKSVRVYASGSNLKTFSKYKGIDPEVAILGLAPGVDDRNRYPATSTYTLGAFFTF